MTGREHQEPAGERPMMTMRISRDSGRTWTDKMEIRAGAPLDFGAWPQCACPHHAPDRRTDGDEQ